MAPVGAPSAATRAVSGQVFGGHDLAALTPPAWAPAAVAAINALPARPDLLLCDGQGYAPPRRMGIACHLGLLTDLPSIGVAKSRLVGTCGPVPAGRISRPEAQ